MTERLPLLLMPGWNGRPREMSRMARFFVNAGWPGDHVNILAFRDIWGSNIAHADEIRDAIDQLRQQTGSPRVDLIAFSMSGLAARWHLAHAEQPAVRRVVFVGTPHLGTILAHVGWGQGAREMRPGSDFLKTLATRPFPPEIHAFTVRTRLETRVFPAANARLDCALADYCVRFTTHPGMLKSPEVFTLVLSCLEHPNPTPPPSPHL
jgi:pimeloyl-ACP methyl ester carboxylesterase